MNFLLDTNVISEVRKPRGNAGVKAWISSTDSDKLHLSVLVIGEIRRGIELLRRTDQTQAGSYELWLKSLTNEYGDRVLPITLEVVEEWGRINVPDYLPIVDGLMAATAKVRDMTFVTRNTTDVERSDVRLLNPFE
ncbi:MAG: type II toxin-antitoxin system VapC family toxin [Rubrobacteraceae bacterium]